MANVKNFAYPASVIVLLLLYGLFLVWENRNYSDGQRRLQIVNQHLNRLQELKQVDGLIIGGSNSYYGLSADILSNSLGEKWYNASLMNGGYSNQNMLTFIENVRNSIASEAVKTVIYSSVYVYQKGSIHKRNYAVNGVDGRSPVSIKPQRSAASHLKQWIRSEKYDPDYPPLADERGDMIFTEKACPAQLNEDEYAKEDPSIVADFLRENLNALNTAFPNAKLLFVFPSVYEGQIMHLQRDQAYKHAVAQAVERQLKSSKHGRSFKYELIFQPKFPGRAYVCDYPHHASLTGRKWRTNNLLTQMNTSRFLASD